MKLLVQCRVVRDEAARRREVVAFLDPRVAVRGTALIRDGEPGWHVAAVYGTHRADFLKLHPCIAPGSFRLSRTQQAEVR